MTARARQRGFALLLVLWVVVFLAAVAVHFSASGRTQIALARNVLDAARAEALADGAIMTALFTVVAPQGGGWPADGSPHVLAFDDGQAAVAVMDENARVNPNLAGPRLLAALFEAVGSGRDDAEQAAAALVQRRAELAAALLLNRAQAGAIPEGANVVVEQGREAAAFVFESLDDLEGIDGLPTRLLAAARPFLSIYAELPLPATAYAAPPVRQAVAKMLAGAPPQPARPAPVPDGIYRITASATTAGGARFVREAVAKADRNRPAGYAMLYWRRVGSTD